MTKAIPEGAPRKRQARVCVLCRASKLRCVGAELPEGAEEGVASTACERCSKSKAVCEFVKSKRMGRPRRLPKEEESKSVTPDSEDDGEGDQDEGEEPSEVSTLAGQVYAGAEIERLTPSASASVSPSALPSPYPMSEIAASPSSSSSAQTTSLAARYLQEVHPWLPLLPASMSFLLAHFESGHASINLCFALTTLLSAPTPFPITFDSIHLSRSIYDAQAALLLFTYHYGMGDKDRARPFINWLYETIRSEGWHLPSTGMQGLDREMARRIFWESSSAEIILAVTSGVRDLRIQELNPTTVVTDEDTAIYGATSFVCKVRALALLRDLMDPSIKPTPQEYATVVEFTQGLIAESKALLATSFIGIDLTGLSIDDRANLEMADEQAFWSYLVASSALVNVLCSTSSYASAGFECGSDYTTVLTNGFPLIAAVDRLTLGTNVVDARDIIHDTCQNTFNFLKAAFATPFAHRPHSPSYACVLMMGSMGLISSARVHLENGSVPPSISNLRAEDSGRLLRDHAEFAQVMLEDQNKKWPNAGRVAKGLRMMQVAWFVAPPTMEAQQEARDLVTSFHA